MRRCLLFACFALVLGLGIWSGWPPAATPPSEVTAAGATAPNEPPSEVRGAAVPATGSASDATAAPGDPVRRSATPAPVPTPADAEVDVAVEWLDGIDARPVADTSVVLSSEPTGGTGAPWTDHARTGADGRVRFTVPDGDGRTVVVRAGLGATATAELTAASPLRLVLRVRPRAVVHGTVVDAVRQPVAAADVVFAPFAAGLGDGPMRQIVARTGADGSFVLPLERGGHVGAERAGFAPAEPHLVVITAAGEPKRERIELTLLGRDARVDGIVVDAGNRAVAGAWIELQPATRRPGGLLAVPNQVRSDEQGRFTAGPLRPGPTGYVAKAPGHGLAIGTFEASVDHPAELRIGLPPACHLRGAVSSPSGQPIAGAAVRVVLAGAPTPLHATTDDQGTFRFADLPPGRLDASVEHAGLRATRTFVLDPAEPQHWICVLGADADAAARLRGLLLDTAGLPLAGWHVRATWSGGRAERARTGADGSFDLAAVDPAPADLFVHAPGRPLSSFATARFPGVVASRERQRHVVDTTSRAGAVVGRVQSEQHVETPAAVALWHVELREYASANAAPDGSFRFDDVPPGTVEVSVRLAGHALLRRSDVRVVAGQPTELGTLVVHAAGGVSGTVVGPGGTAPAELEVAVLTQDARLVGDYASGQFRVADVPAGRHQLQFQGPGIAGRTVPIEVTAGAEVERQVILQAGVERRIQIEVPQSAGGTVTLALRTRSGEPMQWLASQPAGDTGTVEFLACMLPGSYEVVAFAAGHEARGTIDFPAGGLTAGSGGAGEEAPVRLRLQPR